MKKKSLKLAALMLVTSLLMGPAYGGWVDDWVSQKVETSPGYFAGQKRGYLTGGGFSARWQTGSDYLWTVEPPRFRVGCGGIDLTAGSMSYLDFQHLTQKFQRILANAPAAAFDMAMQTLCQPCKQTMSSLSALADAFNNLQVNDCQASKALVAAVVPGLTSDAVQNKSGLSALNYAVSGGADNWWGGVKEKAATFGNNFSSIWADNAANAPTPAGAVQGKTNPSTLACPAALQDFIPDQQGTMLSMLNVVGVSKRGLSQDYVDLIRGVIGDIEILNIGGQVKVNVVTPCSQQRQGDPDIFLDGSANAKGYTDTGERSCATITDAHAALTQYVQNKMQSIVDKMKTKSNNFTNDDIAFLNASPMGLAITLKTAIGTANEGAVIATMADLTAKAYAYYMLADLYSTARSTIYSLQKAMASKSVDKEGCDLSAFEGSSLKAIEDLSRQVWQLQDSARSEYAASAQEVATVQAILKSVVETQNQLYERIAKDFGSAVAGRVMKR